MGGRLTNVTDVALLVHVFESIRSISIADEDGSTPADDPPIAVVHVMPPFKKFLVA